MALRPTRPQTRAEQLAARDVAQSDAFLREVDDALREEQMLGAVKRYGMLAGGAAVAVLAALGGWLWWGHHQDQLAAERSEQLTIALDQVDANRNDLATKTLDGIAAGKGGSAAVAKLVEAGLLVQQGKTQDAAVRYGALASDGDAPQVYRDFATLRQVALMFDAMKPDEVVAKLKPLAAPGAPWFGPAGELLGMAYIKQGHKELAAPLFGAIARDKAQPDSLRARARQLAGLLGFDAVEDISPEMQPPAPQQPQPAAAPEAAPAAAPAAPAQNP